MARGLRRNPAFSLTAIFIVAVGIGATSAVFSAVDRLLFRSLLQTLIVVLVLGGWLHRSKVANREPLAGKVVDQLLSLGVGEHALDLCDNHGRFVQFAG